MNKEITIKEFQLLGENEKNQLMEDLNEAGEAEKIIELLTATPLKELSINMLNWLAVAYNNVDLCYKAMELMDLIPEKERDAKWYYRYGYSLVYKDFSNYSDQVVKALTMLDKACEMSQDDEVKDWCRELIFNNGELESFADFQKLFPRLYDYYTNSDLFAKFAFESFKEGVEDLSSIFALLLEEPLLTEEAFIRVRKIDGIEIKSREPFDDKGGQMVVSYEGLDFKVEFFSKEFSPSVVKDIQPQFFSKKEKELIDKTKFAFYVVMNFAGNPQIAYHLQLKLIYAFIPEVIAIFDENACRLLNRRWVELAINSKCVPSVESLYTVHAVNDENQVWLHTHGLNRCHLHEVEILDSNVQDYNIHYQVISTYAGLLLNEYIKAFDSKDKVEEIVQLEKEELFNLGVFEDESPIVATSVTWEEAITYYPEDILGGIQDRIDNHHYKTNPIFLYGGEEDVNENHLRKVSEFTDKLSDNPILFISAAETERMSLLAKERFPYAEKIFKEKQGNDEDFSIIIKLGLATIDDEGNFDEENREHIWFELLSIEKEGIKAKLIQEPYRIPDIHEGDVGFYSLDDITDWHIFVDDMSINPEMVYLLDLKNDTMKNQLIYNKENREDFFEKIDGLIDKDKYTECINALENIPLEERDYRISYQLARSLQNFAIIGNDNKGTEIEIGDKALLKSLEILESVREEGESHAEWNMRMAYGYQYLSCQEEKAIPYALRWAELDPNDENALLVVKECEEEIEHRNKIISKQIKMDKLATEEIGAILKDNNIENGEEYRSKSEEELAFIYENIKTVQEKYGLVDEEIEDILDEILGEYEEDDELDGNWGVYFCKWFDKQPAVVRVNLDLADFNDTKKISKRIQLSVMLKNPDENGFPTGEEEETLYKIEDLIENIIKEKQGILVAFLRWDKRLSIFAYVENEVGYEEAFSVALKEKFPDYKYKFWVDEDEEWDTYFNILYPDKYEYQSILNDQIIYHLQMAGDTMVPRVLEYCLYFKTKEKREEFFGKVLKDGFTRIDEGSDEDIDLSLEYPYQIVVGREDKFNDVDTVVWKLMDLAEELDGDFDGWGCSVVKEERKDNE